MERESYEVKKRFLKFYKKKAEEWKNEHDDRKVFSNIYYILDEALEEMKNIENNYIWCAFNKRFSDDIETLNDIENKFKTNKKI